MRKREAEDRARQEEERRRQEEERTKREAEQKVMVTQLAWPLAIWFSECSHSCDIEQVFSYLWAAIIIIYLVVFNPIPQFPQQFA